jgi:uncharacterized radical SAM superfamily protein
MVIDNIICFFEVILNGQILFYKERGVSLDEYIKTVGLRKLIKEKKLKMVLEQFISDENTVNSIYKKYRKEYFVMKPLNFKNLLPFE